MHFKNGREAKPFDPVVFTDYANRVQVGRIYNLNPGSNTCNCDVAVIVPGGVQQLTCQTVGNMLHAEDGLNASISPVAATAPTPESPA